MSRILCVIDGMTDPEFRFGEYKNLSALRILEYRDNCGGQQPETLNCLLSLLGVKDQPPFLRGYIEALGAGITVSENDLILRGSYFSLDEKGCCQKPKKLPQVFGSLPCEYHLLGGNQCLLIYHNMARDLEQLITYSPAVFAGEKAVSLCPKGCKAVSDSFYSFLNEKSCMMLWGQSVKTKLKAFSRPAAAVCKKNIVKGIAQCLKMQLFEPDRATADTDTDLIQKAETALLAAERYPFVLLHINGADEAAHRKNGKEKREFLSRIDDAALSRLLASQHEIVITADHGADPETGLHTSVRQPVFYRA